MSISTSKQVAIGATLFILSSAAKSADSVIKITGKSSLGVDHLSLDEMAGRNLTICSNDTGESSETGILGNDLTIPVDPFSSMYMTLIFSVSDILSTDQDQILFLVYSTGLASSPQILTPRSIKPLELDLTYNEIAAIYNIPKQSMIAQDDTRIGRAYPDPNSKVSFKISLEANKIVSLIRNGQPTIYVQAALMRKADFDSSQFQNMILSEADRITFIGGSDCSGKGAKMRNNDDGQLTISNRSGTIGLTKSGSTTKFFGLGK